MSQKFTLDIYDDVAYLEIHKGIETGTYQAITNLLQVCGFDLWVKSDRNHCFKYAKKEIVKESE